MTSEKKGRVLVVRTDRIGDVVATLPMISALKQHGAHEVVVLVRSYTTPIFEFETDADEVILFDPAWSMRRKVKCFEEANVTTAFFPSPRPDLLIAAAAARIPKRVATGYRWY